MAGESPLHIREGKDELASTPSSAILTRKHYSNEELADLALVNPKRAKRIMTDRNAAARYKARQKHQTSELELKAQKMETEISRLLSELTVSQNHKSALTFENRALKLQLQGIGECAKLQEELTRVLQAEAQRLKLVRGQSIVGGGNSSL